MFDFLSGESGRASRTAEFMAFFRALESCRPGDERLFDDPLAIAFLRPSLRFAVSLARLPFGTAVPRFVDRRWPGARSSGVTRTRLIDDALVEALSSGFDQFVLLGAGFDSRAYRLPGIDHARVFEVDHPATLGVKKARLQRVLGRLPGHVTYVEVDFEHQDVDETMRSLGLDPNARAFFVWEGVTNYLSASAVDATLRAVAAVAGPGSRVLFTYVHQGLLDGSVAFSGTRRLFTTLQRVGEPWTFGLDPAEVREFLARRGFHLVGDWGAADYRSLYMGCRAHRIRGYEFYRAALAELRPRADTRARPERAGPPVAPTARTHAQGH